MFLCEFTHRIWALLLLLLICRMYLGSAANPSSTAPVNNTTFTRVRYEAKKLPAWSKSTLYVMGVGKDVVRYIPYIQQNVAQIIGLFKTYKIFIYSGPTDIPGFERWANFDEHVEIVEEVYRSDSRTDRIAHGRNTLMAMIHEDYSQSNKKSPAYVMVIDMDEINIAPFNVSVFHEVMGMASQWDAVSFNRNHYYDIWALRYDRFDVNVWGFGSQSRTLRDVIEADIVSLLDTSKPSLYPVKSAFGGVGIYKLNMTIGCRYNGSNPDTFAASTNYGKARGSAPEDCEHVAFHRCMSERHNAKIQIFSGILVNRILNEGE